MCLKKLALPFLFVSALLGLSGKCSSQTGLITWNSEVTAAIKTVFEKKPALVFEVSGQTIMTMSFLDRHVDLKGLKSFEETYLLIVPEKFKVEARKPLINDTKNVKSEKGGMGFISLDNGSEKAMKYESILILEIDNGKETKFRIIIDTPADKAYQYWFQQKDKTSFLLKRKSTPNALLKNGLDEHSPFIIINNEAYNLKPEIFLATIIIESVGKSNSYHAFCHFPEERF